MHKNYADVLESYMIAPATEGAKLVPFNQTMSLIPSSINSSKELSKLQMSLDRFRMNMYSAIKNDATRFFNKIKNKLTPIEECDNKKLEGIVITEVKKILNMYINSQEFKKYCGFYTNLIKLQYSIDRPGGYKSSDSKEKYYGIIKATILDSKVYKLRDKWEADCIKHIMSIIHFTDSENNIQHKDSNNIPYPVKYISSNLNPYCSADNVESVIEYVIKSYLKKIFPEKCVGVSMVQGGLDISFGTYNDEMSEETKHHMIKSIISDFRDLMKKNGIESSKKTYMISKDLTNEDYPQISYVYYDDNYSDSGSDYDNGLTKSDIIENKKFESTLSKVLNELKRKYPKAKFNDDGYRGHGSIYISVN